MFLVGGTAQKFTREIRNCYYRQYFVESVVHSNPRSAEIEKKQGDADELSRRETYSRITHTETETNETVRS